MREETQTPIIICAICKKRITQQDWPCKGLPNGDKAHLACYIDHMHDDESKPAPLIRAGNPQRSGGKPRSRANQC